MRLFPATSRASLNYLSKIGHDRGECWGCQPERSARHRHFQAVVACLSIVVGRHGTLRLHRRLLRKRPAALRRGVLRRGCARTRVRPQAAPARRRRRARLARDRLCALLRRSGRRRPGAGDGRGRPGRRARAAVAATFIDGRFEDRAKDHGAFDVVTIGRAIHWLDPGPAPRALDGAVKPFGRILVCHASSVDDGRNSWLQAFKVVRDRWRDDRPKYDRDVFFADGPFVLARDDQRRDGDRRLGQTPRRPYPVDVDLLAGAARRRGPGDAERHRRSTGAFRSRWDDSGHRRGGGGGVRARNGQLGAGVGRPRERLLPSSGRLRRPPSPRQPAAAITPSSGPAPVPRSSSRACPRARPRRGPSPHSRRRYRAPIQNIARPPGSPSRPCASDGRARGRCP